jgi:hypothetical protein
MNKINISAEPVLPLLRARRDVLDTHLGDCHLRHVDQSVDSKFPSDRRHSRRAILRIFLLQCAGWLVPGLGDKVFAPY